MSKTAKPGSGAAAADSRGGGCRLFLASSPAANRWLTAPCAPSELAQAIVANALQPAGAATLSR